MREIKDNGTRGIKKIYELSFYSREKKCWVTYNQQDLQDIGSNLIVLTDYEKAELLGILIDYLLEDIK